MKPTILQDYEITNETLALLPSKHHQYETIAVEATGHYYIQKSAIRIMKEACLMGGSTYDGRRAAVIHLTNSKHKVPIPIDPSQYIYAFPTHSPKDLNCSWLFYKHIYSISPLKNKEAIVTFTNRKQLQLPVSHYTLEKQIQRTSHCLFRFSQTSFELLPNRSIIQNPISS